MSSITLLGSRYRAGDGLNRREALRVGALSLLGGFFSDAGLYALEQAGRRHVRPGRAKQVLFLYLQGGPPTQDMFDLKPDAPSGIRSEFRPIATSAPGVTVCELLPRLARWMHRAVVVRSVYHRGGCHNNLPMHTGYDVPPPDIESARGTDPPSIGSVLACVAPGRGLLPTYVGLPCPIGWGEHKRKPGQGAGFLGSRYEPFCTECTAYVDQPPEQDWHPQVVRGAPRLADMELPAGFTIDALNGRRRLLDQLDEQRQAASGRAQESWTEAQRRAFQLLTSAQVRAAFDWQREPDQLQERYGRTLFGTSALLARRLIERGVRFVNVSWDNFSNRYQVSKAAWDTHERNFPVLRTYLPSLDQTYAALLEDLEQRGLLDETLVVLMGEMGRTPGLNPKGGRDHWTFCYSVVLAGAGLRGGSSYGASDAQAAFIRDRPVHVRDICATIYELLGIDPEMPVYDRSNRPIPVAHGGQPIRDILA